MIKYDFENVSRNVLILIDIHYCWNNQIP